MSNFNERKNFMFMKRTTIFIFILLQFTLAQAPNKYRMAGTGVILGEVIHADTGVAIEYASVSLISKKSNEVVTGQLTDGRGVFVFQELKKGNYFLEIRFMCFEPWISSEINISFKVENQIDMSLYLYSNLMKANE